jgi:hypothetical protein
MVKHLLNLLRVSGLLILSSCLSEKTVITTDFDNVKLSESPNPLSPYYVKGVVRGMPFSYSTNDSYYSNTKFQNFSDTTIIKYPGLFFSIGNFGEYLPVYFYIQSNTIWFNDFIKNLMKSNTNFILAPKSTAQEFQVFFYARYYDPNYAPQLTRGFNCCFYGNKNGQLTISKVETFTSYTNVTFQFAGPLYSTDNTGDILYFGDASIEMCVRINQ